jgi:beta-lactamase superfamily II metal-dependent hydrolase
MATLAVTIIDVGWGDSALVVSTDEAGVRRYALIDCNDHENERSSLIFLKRYFERTRVDYRNIRRNFEWVLLTHGHADHARGMRRVLETFGTENFWYPKSVPSTAYSNLLQYANRSNRVAHHQAVDSSKVFDSIPFGGVHIEAIWPDHDRIDIRNENNNSVVMALTLGDASFVMTGDAEASNWAVIEPRLPATLRVLQAPHHGARNGLFHGAEMPWLARAASHIVAISSHTVPHGHPHPDVVQALTSHGITHYRTDEHYHLTFETDGTDVHVRYSH